MERTFVHDLAYSTFALACGVLIGIGEMLAGGPNYCPFIYGGACGFVLVTYFATRQDQPRYLNLNEVQKYEHITVLNEGHTLSRTTLDLTSEDMAELKTIAELWVMDELTYRAFEREGLSMDKWKVPLKRDGWWMTDGRGQIVKLRRGERMVRDIQSPLPRKLDAPKYRGFTPTHTREGL